MKNTIKYVVSVVAVLVFLAACGATSSTGGEETAGQGSDTVVKAAASDMTVSAKEEKTPAPTPTATPEPPSKTVKVGDQVKKIYETDGKFTSRGKKHIFEKNDGSAFRGGFFVKDNHLYFARKDGEIVKGWLKYRGNIYFFNRKDGKLTTRKQVEGVTLGKYGIAKAGKQNQERAETYLKASNTLRKITKSADKKSKKLYKCYRWVMKHTYVRHRKMREMMQRKDWKKTWDIVFANDIFDKHSGCCVSYAAAFALLARECGYKKVTLCCDTGHAWDDIGGRLYDPLFASSRSFSQNYNARYTDYRSYAAIKKKIS